MRLNKDLLVFIFYKALSFGREACHDGLVCFLHRFFYILRSFSLGQDGVVDGESQFTASDEAETFRTWKDVERAVDRYGDYGQLQFVRQLECSFLEHSHVSGERAGTFGKYYQRGSFLQDFTGFGISFLNLFRSRLVYEDVTCALACFSDQEDFPQRFFHHPFEIASQEAVNQKDVECPLVVGHEYV